MGETTVPEAVDTLVVGAGHAGLTMSSFLRQRAIEHVVVERRNRLGGSWQDRWDEFTLVTPNWTSSFVGFPYDGPDPGGFMHRDRIVDRVARYADAIDAPVVLSTGVERLTPTDGEFRIRTTGGDLSARRVIVATGSYHRPRVPGFAAAISPRVTQLHSHDYRNEAALPAGAVLVVGTGQTGVQLAEELHGAGRQVYLCVGRAGRVPRRYRGRDLFEWLAELGRRGPAFGLGLPTVDRLPHPDARFEANPHLSGRDGGHDTDLRRLAADGIRLTGRLAAVDGERVTFGPDLAANLDYADGYFDARFREAIDALIERATIDAPPDDRIPFDFQPTGLTELDLADAGVSTIVWATGYALDYGWIDAPIFGERGYPQHERGVTRVPGLYFLGLLWQHTQTSATLLGPSVDAAYLIDQMGERDGGG